MFHALRCIRWTPKRHFTVAATGCAHLESLFICGYHQQDDGLYFRGSRSGDLNHLSRSTANRTAAMNNSRGDRQSNLAVCLTGLFVTPSYNGTGTTDTTVEISLSVVACIPRQDVDSEAAIEAVVASRQNVVRRTLSLQTTLRVVLCSEESQ